MATGTVKWFNDAKGYGFIKSDDNNKDVFVHHTGIKMEGFRSLNEGQKVHYDMGTGPKGKSQAENVRIMTDDEYASLKANAAPVAKPEPKRDSKPAAGKQSPKKGGSPRPSANGAAEH